MNARLVLMHYMIVFCLERVTYMIWQNMNVSIYCKELQKVAAMKEQLSKYPEWFQEIHWLDSSVTVFMPLNNAVYTGTLKVVFKWGHPIQFSDVNVEQCSAKKAKASPKE